MRIMKMILPFMFLCIIMLLFPGCEKYAESDEINGLIRQNDMSISIKANEDRGFTTEKIYENGNKYCLKIVVKDTYSLRGKAVIKPGDNFRLSFTLKNVDADPVIGYSFWKEPKTSLRHYIFNGENGNPPTSVTQEQYDWETFEETFETHEVEDSFMLTLLSGEGTFYIREINIERLN